MLNNKKKYIVAVALAAVIGLTGCASDSDKSAYIPPRSSQITSTASSKPADASTTQTASDISYAGSDATTVESTVSSSSSIEYPDIVCSIDFGGNSNKSESTASSTSVIEYPDIVCSIEVIDVNSDPKPETSASKPETPASPVSDPISDIKNICGLRSKVETDISACIVDTYNDHNPYDVEYNYGDAYNKYVSECDWGLVFDADFYIENFPLLAMQYHNDKNLLLEHFQTIGVHEGRQGSANFNVGVYMSNCGSDIKNAFGNNYEGYYFYYMLNYASEKSVNAMPDSDSKLQQKMIMTACQAAELKGVNRYRKEVNVPALSFDSELGAFANYRAYLNAHDGYKAHEWLRTNNDIAQHIMSLYDAYNLSENTVTVNCNRDNCNSKHCNFGGTRYENYRASESHYNAMVNIRYDLIGCGNCYKAPHTVSQFDCFIDL